MSDSLFIRSKLMQAYGFNAIFSQRVGGVSHQPFDSLNFGSDLGDSEINIEENLSRLLKSVNLSDHPHRAKQVHGADSLWCEGSGYSHKHEVDILFTQSVGIAVAVQTADCLPILLADKKTKMVAAVHAGWRGTVAGVVKVALKEMCAKAAHKEDVVASLGPCIGLCCFEVSMAIAEKLSSSCSSGEQYMNNGQSIYADLLGINHQQLLDDGVLNENIEQLSHCTCCHSHIFYSYRREKGLTGRHLAIVAVPTAD